MKNLRLSLVGKPENEGVYQQIQAFNGTDNPEEKLAIVTQILETTERSEAILEEKPAFEQEEPPASSKETSSVKIDESNEDFLEISEYENISEADLSKSEKNLYQDFLEELKAKKIGVLVGGTGQIYDDGSKKPGNTGYIKYKDSTKEEDNFVDRDGIIRRFDISIWEGNLCFRKIDSAFGFSIGIGRGEKDSTFSDTRDSQTSHIAITGESIEKYQKKDFIKFFLLLYKKYHPYHFKFVAKKFPTIKVER